MRLPSIHADLRSIQVNAPQFSQIQLISGHLLMGAFPNFYPNSSCIFWKTPDPILVSVAAEMVAFQ